MTSAAPIEKKGLRFRARSFVAFALTPEAPLGTWLDGLDRWTANSPGFFASRPVVLDLKQLKLPTGEIAVLVAQLAERGIRVYAIEAKGIEAFGPELPPLLKGAKETTIQDVPQATAAAVPAEPPKSETLIIKSPIRSGQSIFHPEGDVIVIGSVGSGSEIIAGGSIHVYGTLRGRAFAGASGNGAARVFCRKNEAELLAVNGWYQTAEDFDPATRGRPVQAFLDNDMLWVTALD